MNEVQNVEGKLYLLVAIDLTYKFSFFHNVDKTNRLIASDFLLALINAALYKIHTFLIDAGIQFRIPPSNPNAPKAKFSAHIFDWICNVNPVEHRFTTIDHPWMKDQVERMTRTIEETTVKRYHYDDYDQLRRRLSDFVDAYNFGRRFKTIIGLKTYENICKCWISEPKRFKLNPLRQRP